LGAEYRRIARGYKKAKPPVAQFFISLPLADNERLSEDFVRENYADWPTKSNRNLISTQLISLFSRNFNSSYRLLCTFVVPSTWLRQFRYTPSHFFIRSIHHIREVIASP
jgi:hypothetical protein